MGLQVKCSVLLGQHGTMGGVVASAVDNFIHNLLDTTIHAYGKV